MIGPDFDGDGIGELVVSQEGWVDSPGFWCSDICESQGVYVIPGGTRSEERVSIGSVATFHATGDRCFGASLQAFPDIDGDGTGEILTWTPPLCTDYYEGWETEIIGSTQVTAGGEASDVTTRILPESILSEDTWTPVVVGDTDGDGVEDLLLTAEDGWVAISGASMPTGTVYFDWETDRLGLSDVGNGNVVYRTGDLDGDGLAEVTYVHTPRSGSGELRVIRVTSPIDGTDAWLEVTGEEDNLVGTPAGLDVDGDGYGDLVTIDSSVRDHHGALYVLSVHDRTSGVSLAEAETIVVSDADDTTLYDLTLSDDRLVVSTWTHGTRIAVLDPAMLTPGVVDLSVAAPCVRSGGVLYGPVAGNYLGNGALQIANREYEGTGGRILDSSLADADCE